MKNKLLLITLSFVLILSSCNSGDFDTAAYVNEVYASVASMIAQSNSDVAHLEEKDGEKTLLKYSGGVSEIYIPNGTTQIAKDAFLKIGNVDTFYIPKTVKDIPILLAEKSNITINKVVFEEGTEELSGKNRPDRYYIEYSEYNTLIPHNFGIKELIIPNSAVSVSPALYNELDSLENIHVAENNKEFVSVNGILFSKDMKTLIKYPEGKKEETYTVPDSVENISSGAFMLNPYLRNVVLPSELISIGEKAFYECFSIEKIVIPESVSQIGEGAFVGCKNLSEVEVKNNTLNIDSEAVFFGTLWYVKQIGAEEGKIITKEIDNTEIGEKIETVIIKYIGGGEHFVIPEGIDRIFEPAAFKYSSITEVTLSDSFIEYCYNGEGYLGYILAESFPDAQKYHLPESCTYLYEKDGVLFNKATNALVAFPAGRTGEYVITNDTKIIEEGAFHFSSLESLTVPDHVEALSQNSFFDIIRLKKVKTESK